MKSATSKAAAARAHGKTLVQVSLVWQLNTHSLNVRCRALGEKPDGSGDSFVVEGSARGKWLEITRGEDPMELLQRLIRTPQILKGIYAGWQIVKKD